MKTFQNKSLLSRTVSLTLTVGLCLSFCLAVKAADLLSYPIKTAIAKRITRRCGTLISQ